MSTWLLLVYIGALIALPTLRLSGIYLALATAAFAVFLERAVTEKARRPSSDLDRDGLAQRPCSA
jgi:ABC-type branched-subunit amino acid transport system permease subunit